MALEEYQRKRNFQSTPEPAGKVESSERHRFVVQKHRATRLHYDFRLEMDGVLKSWAIPKGPSLDPADKRLAMQVEDHPVSYFDFEGIIPPGNYGAGTVMVWDLGTWQPVGDAAEMLRKGDLKFRLEGQKLKGEFALVHMKARRPGSKGTEWLLIKHRDAYVEADYDIEQFDRSVLTHRSMDEIAADAGSAEWESSRKASATRSRKNDWLAESIARADAIRVAASQTRAASGPESKTPADAASTKTPHVKRKTAKASSGADQSGTTPSKAERLRKLMARSGSAKSVKKNFPLAGESSQ